MKKFLIALIIEFVLLCALYNYLITKFFPDEYSWLKVVIIAAVMMIPVAIIHGVLANRKEIALLRQSGNPTLKDGERVALTGYIRPMQEAVLSPFTKKQCIGYAYKVSTVVGSGKSRVQRTEYSGTVQVPSVIRTNMMEVRLLGFIEGEETAYDEMQEGDQAIVQNAYEYLSNRQFKPKINSFSEAWKTAKNLITDNDGSICEEFKIVDAQLDLSGRTFEESCIEINKPYSLIGVWSSAQNGLLSDPFGKGNITVLEGDAEQAIKKMRSRIGCMTVAAIFLLVFLNAMAIANLKH
jgi:hypothetical protein